MEHLTTEDGLSQGTIFDIAKDQDGFMWFYTKDGLNRYDGYDFKVFKNNPYDSTSIQSYHGGMLKLLVDSKNRLWVNSNALYDRNKEIFYHLKTNHKGIKGLVEDKEGNLWCHNKKAIFQLIVKTAKDGTTSQLQLVEKMKFKIKDRISGLTCINDGTLLLGTRAGIFKINRETNQLEQFLDIGGNVIMEYPKGTLWIKSNDNLMWLQNGKLTTLKFTLNQQPFNRFHQVRINPATNKIWIHSEVESDMYGIDLLPLKEEYDLDQSQKIVIELGGILSFYDDGKTLWLGRNGYGIQKIMQQEHPFHHFAVGSSTQGSMTLVNENLLALPFYIKPKNLAISIPKKGYPKQITTTFSSVLTTKDGKNWMLRRDNRQHFLLQMDENLLEEARYLMVDKVHGIQLPAFIEGKNGHLWIGSKKGLIKFDRKKKVTTLIKRKTPLKSHGKHLYQDRIGVFWNCTGEGLIKIKIDKSDKMTEQVYQHDPTDIHSLSHNVVNAVLDDPKNPNRYLWVATKSGLNKLDKKTGKFTHFTTKDGLPNDVIYGILADDDGNLWLSTNNGLSKFNPTEKTFRNFVKSDGLQDNEFNSSGFLKDEKTGILYFGGINGITAFHPKDIKLSPFKPKVYISQLKIHGEAVEVGKPLEQEGENPLTKAIEYTEKIRLPWYQNQITLAFASLDFYKPNKNQYQYQLSSIDKDWVQASTRRSVNYSNLATGTYTFRLKGTNSDGRWNEEETILTIVIYPPWYRTNLAYILYVILLIFGVYKLYQNQVRRAKLRNELEFEQKEAARLAEVDKIKTNFFANITHEFRTPLTLIIEPLRQYLKNPKREPLSKVQLAKNNSERLLNLVNQLLDLSKLESKKMNLELKRGNFLEFVAPIMASFDGLAKQKNIQFIYNTPNELPFFDFDKNKIEKVLFNLISNAIKFTKNNGTVTINIIENTQHQELKIQVIDTGIGIPTKEQPHIFDRFYQVDGSNTREHEGTGIGLALSKELMEVMNGSLIFNSELGKGSTFEVLIPMVQVSSVMNKLEQLEPIAQYEIPLIPMAKISNQTSKITIDPDATNVALVIEDNEELRLFIKSSIEHQYKVIEAKNGQEGLNLAIKYLPNIIVSDVMMPLMDGFEVCKRVKTNEKTAHIPVILLTAKTAMDSVLKGLAYKADAYMKKPFNIEELLVRMKNLIEVRVLLQQKFTQTLETMPLLVAEPTKGKLFKQSIPEDPNLSSFDQRFLKSISNVVEQNLDNENLTIEDLAKTATMSRSQLYRKIKALLNQTPSEFIRNIRLKAAKQFLEQGKGNITDVTFMVGFSSPSYFSTQFKKKYGVKPSEV